MGETGANTYFRWTVSPGEHIILSYTENVAGIVINAEPGRIYYVWQETKMGFFQPRSELTRMDRITAEIALRSCYLLGKQELIAGAGEKSARTLSLSREALIKSRMRDRGDLGRGQVGEDAV